MAMKEFIPDIQKLANKYNEPSLFINIVKAIKKGQAYPYYQRGMLFILKPIIKDKQKTMFVWVGIHKVHNNLANDITHLEIMAKLTGFTHIRFESTRKGFKKYAPLFGYLCVGKRNQYDIYEKKVA